MANITWDEFMAIELRIGTVITADEFPEARNPSYILKIDFGSEIGIKKTSAQITDLYSISELIGKQVVAVTNFPPKQIGPLMSEVLVTGFHTDKGVSLIEPNHKIKNGTRLL